MGNDRIDLKYHVLLDNLGICVSTAGLPKYSWRARLYTLLPRWIQPLFPGLHAIYQYEDAVKKGEFMNLVFDQYDKFKRELGKCIADGIADD